MRWWLIGLVALAGAGLLVWAWKREQEPPADLAARWRAFIESDPIVGEKRIVAAKVPPVKPLKGVRVDQFARFRRRCQ